MKKLIAKLAVLAGLALAMHAHAAPPTSPNIVFIMADDHGRQAISCYGPSMIQTPQIDRLARDGVRFTEDLATNSICSPSRATLLTGKYNHLCGVHKLNDRFDGSQQTFPKLLQQAGYLTAIIGKWHLASEPTGFNYYCVLPGQGRYNDPAFKEIGHPWGGGPAESGGIVHKGYVTDLITDMSLDWLKHRDASKPFCLMIHHKAPHGPHTPAERDKDLFKDDSLPEPSNLLDDYAGRAPEIIMNHLPTSRLIQNSDPPYPAVRKRFTGDMAHDTRMIYQVYAKDYLRVVAALDENVGRVLDYLDQSGLAKNTIVIYTSDNGFFLGEHGFYDKRWMYEESLHLPLLVRLPPGSEGFKPGTVNNQLVSMLDIAPTLLELAGAKVPADIQGVSMKPLLTGTSGKWRDAFYYHFYDNPGEIIGIRTKTAKLVFYPRWKGGPFWEYFDLEADVHEMHNLYADSAYRQAVAGLKKQLYALTRQYKDPEATSYLDGVKPVHVEDTVHKQNED
jgi:arylsulfatase A-like enzyme